MPCSLTGRTKRPILIATPQALKTAYAAIDGDFEGTTVISGTTYDLLRLYPDSAGGYRQRQRQLESKGIRFGYNGVTFATYSTVKDLEFEFAARVRTPVAYILIELQAIQAASGQLVTLHDYARPSYTDIKAAIAGNTEPFTVRRGELIINEVGAFVGKALGPRSEEEPIKITFKQVG